MTDKKIIAIGDHTFPMMNFKEFPSLFAGEICNVQPLSSDLGELYNIPVPEKDIIHVDSETEYVSLYKTLNNVFIDDTVFECKTCGTVSYAVDCEYEYYCSDEWTWMTLCGREGWFFYCPICNEIVAGRWAFLS